jgi:hypothetical protein
MRPQLTLLLLLAASLSADDIDTVVPGPMVITQKLTGDMVQVYNWNIRSPNMYGQPTAGIWQSAANSGGHMGVWGLDEGACALVPNTKDIICITGDVESSNYTGSSGSPAYTWQAFGRDSDTCGLHGGIGGGTASCLGLKAVYVIQNNGGAEYDPSGCAALPNLMSALMASPQTNPTAKINYAGCNPVTYFADTSRNYSTQPMFAAPTITLSPHTTTDQAGNPLIIMAGHEFQDCAVVTIGVPYLLCAVNESRIKDAAGSAYYLGATVLQQIPLGAIYSGPGGTLQINQPGNLPFEASYTGTGFGVLSNSPPITALSGLTIRCTQTPNCDGSSTYTYSVTSPSAVFADASGGDIEIPTSSGGSNHGIINFVSADSKTAYVSLYGGLGVSTPWDASQTTATVQPAQAGNVGKFLVSSIYYISAAELPTWPWASQLPSTLQSPNARDGILCMWGATGYGRSNLYFGCIDVDAIADSSYAYSTSNGITSGGLGSMWYVTNIASSGAPSWEEGAEQDATPLLTTWNHTHSKLMATQDCVNEHGVDWSPGLNRWTLSYGFAGCGAFMVRTAQNPWGPWSEETSVMQNEADRSTEANWQTNFYPLLTYNDVGAQTGLTNINGTDPTNTVTCSGCIPNSNAANIATNVLYEGVSPGYPNSPTGPWTNTASGYGFRWYPGQEHKNADGTVVRSAHVSLANPYAIFDTLIQFSAPGPVNPAEFNDVSPTATYFDAANLMFQIGVTAGCIQGSTPLTRSFCPNDNVTREEMAAFIVRAVTGTLTPAIYNPVPYFTDVPTTNPFFPHIQKLEELGITIGCGPGLFCPTDAIPRWEMAIFMVRARLALYGASFTSSSTPYFADVPVNVEGNGVPFPFIQRAYEEHITDGCGTGPLIYCPDELVTRGQMASFIMRGLFNETTILGPTAPQVTDVSPNRMAATAGTQIRVTITAVNTNFQSGDAVTVPSGMLAVSNVTVNSATTISATLTANATVVAGPQALVVTTGGQNLTLPLAIKVGTY